MTRRGTIQALGATLLLPACRASVTALDAQVIVLGAGLSGLYAAMLLEDEGYDVLVLEALDRIGGRMFTLDHGDGYTEGGGQQIGASYARVLDVAEQLGVPLYAETRRGPETSHYLNGGWQTEGLEIPQFPAAFRNIPPSSVLFHLLRNEPGLANSESWLEAAPEYDISAAQFLAERGFDDAARGLIDRALNANSLETYSMLNLHRTWQLYKQSAGMGETRYVEGGSQRLPEAMANSLNRPVRLNTRVGDIEVGNNSVEISTSSGPLRADHVVCTLPFPALRAMPSLMKAAPNADAIRLLPYTQIAQYHMRANTPFWESDALGPSVWTDSPVERVFAGTDRNGGLTGFHRGWVNGTRAGAASPFGSDGQAYADAYAAIRPAAKDALTPLSYIDWTTSNELAGGAYYHWAPGQASRFGRSMGQPMGRVHFAGEHLGILHTGMEAAMESAERAALGIIEGSA